MKAPRFDPPGPNPYGRPFIREHSGRDSSKPAAAFMTLFYREKDAC